MSPSGGTPATAISYLPTVTWSRSLAAVGIVVLVLAGYVAWPHFSANPAAEMRELGALLEVEPGDTIADVGAGDGRMTVAAAALVGPKGSIFATEIDRDKREELRAMAREQGLANVQVVEAQPDATGLPGGCCDAVFLRRVYHHISAPAAFARDLRRAVAPDGRVAMIDFTPESHRFLPGPASAPDDRPGHGVKPEAVIRDMEAAGFRLVYRADDWPGRAFCLVFEPAEDRQA